jgi:hypothetical protein
MGLFALRFFARGIASMGTAALLACVLFPSALGVNVADLTSDPNVSKFINAVISNLPDLDKSIQGSLSPAHSGGVDPSQYLDVQGTFQNITNKLKSAGVSP